MNQHILNNISRKTLLLLIVSSLLAVKAYSQPTVSIGAPSLTDTNSGPVSYSVTYTGATTVNLTPSDITLNTSGDATGTVSVLNGFTSNPTVTISTITGDGTLGITIAPGTSDDGALPDLGAGPSTTFNVDNTPPTVSIGAPSLSDTQSGPVTFSVTYSGASSVNLTTGDITLNTTGTATGTVGVSNGATSNPTVTISGISGDGTLGITIAGGTSSDAVGNSDTGAGPSTTFNADNTPPSITIGAPSATDTNTGPVTYSISYSGADNVNLTSGDITLNTTGGANGTVSVSNGTTNNPTVTISGITGNGTLGITIAAGTSSDNAGNTDTGDGPSTTFNVDNVPPTASIGAPSISDTNTGPVTFSVSYSGADNVNLTSGDVTLNQTGSANGSISVSNGTTNNPTVTISSITGDGTLGISIGSASSDDAGNTDAGAGPSTTFNVDNTPPSVAIGAPSATDTQSGPVTFSVTYSGANSVNLTSGDISLNTTGSASGSIGVSNGTTNNPTVTISGITGDGTLGITIAGGTSSDAIGNNDTGAGPSSTFNVDNTPPTVSIGAPSATDTQSGPVTFSITYSGASSVNLTTGDITLNTTGTATGTVGVSNGATSNPTVTISGISGDGTLGITIAGGTSSDAIGNIDTGAGPSSTFNVDNTPPTVSIGAPSATDTNSGPVTFSITYSGADNINLTTGDISLNTTGTANGTVGVSNGTTSNPTVTISGITGDGTLGITIAGGTSSDDAGNSDTGAGPSTTFNVDNIPPTASIGAPSATDTNSGPVTFSITYSGADNINLTTGDISLNTTGTATGTVGVSNGTTSNPTVTISGITGDGTLGITLASASSDDAGNTDAGAGPSTTFNVDNTPPAVSIGAPSLTDTNSGPVTFSITYSGASSVNLTTGDITLNTTGTATGTVGVSNGATSNPTVTISGISGDGTLGITIAGGTSSDAIGNNDTGAGPSSTFNVDNTPPAVSIGAPSSTLTNTGPVTFSVSYSGADNVNLTTGDITLNTTGTANGNVSVSNGMTNNPTVTISSITGDGTLGITISEGTSSDDAGNTDSGAGPSSTFNVDNTPPMLLGSISLVRIYGGVETISFQLTEDITLADGASVTFAAPNTSNPGVQVWDGSDDTAIGTATYENDGTYTRTIVIVSAANNSKWYATAPISQVLYTAGGNIFDLAGNELVLPPTNVSSGDLVPPVVDPDVMTLYPRATSPEKIVFTLDDDAVFSDPNDVQGFTTSSGTVGSAAYDDIAREITLTSAANGQWTSGTTVSYSQVSGNVVDDNGNELANINNHAVVIETEPPVITNVSIPNVNMNVGDLVTATITVSNDDGDVPVLTSGTIGGYALGGFSGTGPTSYTVTFTINEGGNSYAPGDDIPVSNLVLTDLQGNVSNTYNTPISQANDRIDAVSPQVLSIVRASSVNAWSSSGGTSASSVDFSVTFSEAVSGVDVSDFTLATSGSLSGAVVSGISGSGATYTVTVNSYANTGTLRLDFVDNGTVFDTPGGNPVVGALAVPDGSYNSGESYTIVLPEPTENVSLGTVVTSSTNNTITIDFSEPTSVPTNYLIIARKTSGGSFPSVADGAFVSDDIDLSDGTAAKNIIAGGGSPVSYTFNTGLTSGTDYSFEIYAYNLASDNTNDNVDFKTNGTIPAFSKNTITALETTISVGVGSVSVPSTSDTGSEFVPVFTFVVNDDDNNPDDVALDDANFTFNSITFNAVAITNTVSDWSQAIGGVRLSDGTDTQTELVGSGNLTITSNSIIISSIANSSATDLGYITDDASKTYTLSIFLKPDMSGAANYPETIDGLNFHFEIDENGFGYEDAPSISSRIKPGEISDSGIGNNEVTVDATELRFTIEPSGTVAVDVALPQQPEVRATDENGNTDLDYSSVLTVTNAQSIPMSGVPTTPVNGVLTFTNLTFLDDGNGSTGNATLTVYDGTTPDGGASPGPLADGTSAQVNASYSNDTQIASSAVLSEPGSISSLINTQGSEVDVFDFQITDDVSPTINDATETRMSQIVIAQSGDNDVEINNWTEIIAGATLRDDEGNSLTILNGSANITSTTLVFNVDPNLLGNVLDDDTKVYTLSIWLLSSLNASLADVVDNKKFGFQINETNITLETDVFGPQSSTFSSSGANSGNTTNAVDVVATKLVFTAQPPSEALVNANLSTSPVLEAFDENNNRDEDYSSPITVTNAKTLGMSNAPTTISSGLLNFAANFQYTDIGDGSAGNGTLTVTASALAANGLVPASTTSTDVFVRVGASTLITAGATSEPATFSSANDTNPGNFVFDFTVTDDAGAEDDGNPTLISDLVITQGTSFNNASLSDWTQVIEGAILYDDEAGPNSLTGVVGANSITFSAMPTGSGQLGYIGDDAAKVYELHIWLKDSIDFRISGFAFPMVSYMEPTVTVDNKKLEFKVDEINISTVSTGSSFKSGEMLASGNANQIDVSTTAIDFTIEPPVSSSVNTPYSVRTEARDVNDNRDVDFTNNLDNNVTNQGGLAMLNAPTTTDNFTAGVFDFAPNFQYDESGASPAGRLTLQANGLVATSQDIEVIASFDSYVTADNTGLSTSINPKDFDAADIVNDGAQDVVIARFVLHDGKSPSSGGVDDVDGATTNLTDLDIDITGFANLKRIALYAEDIDGNGDGLGTYSEIDEQPAAATINFEDVSTGLFHAADNKTRNFIIVVSFQDTYVDNDPIQVTITNIEARLGGSQFDVGEPLPFTDPAKNFVDVVAKYMVWTISPRSIEGINQDLQEPEVQARDIKGNLDVDYNYNATIERGTPASTAGMNNIPTTFVGGILSFPGFQYTMIGDGTLTVTGSDPDNLTKKDGSVVDVIHVTGTTADTGAADNTPAELNNGISTDNPMSGGSVNRIIFGATFDAQHTVTGEPVLEDIVVRFGNPITNVLENIRVYKSDNNNTYEPGIDDLISGMITIDVQSDYITLSGINHDFDVIGTTTIFIMVDIDVTVNSLTPPITPSIVKTDPLSTDVVVSSNASSYANIIGRTYDFVDFFAPVLISQTPANNTENFTLGADVVLEFNEAVTTPDSLIAVYELLGEDSVYLKLRAPDSNTGTVFNFPTVEVDPVTGVDLPGPINLLQSDTWYYATISPGDGTKGFSDVSGNGFEGIDTLQWIFKTSDLTPPELVTGMPTSVVNPSSVGGDLKIALNEKGTIYFMVINDTDADPTIDQILDPSSYTGEILADSLVIIQDSTYHYAPIFSNNFVNGNTYEVHYIAKDNSSPRNVMVAAEMVTFVASDPPGVGLIVDAPTNDVCRGTYQNIFPLISITERNDNDFPNTSGQTFNIVLPPGFTFNTLAENDTVIVLGGDITTATWSYLNNTILQISFDVTGGTNDRDKITISGLEIASDDASNTGDIIRLGGSALTTSLPDNTILGTLGTSLAPTVSFDTDPSSSTIGNNVLEVTLTPNVGILDKGTNVFSGDGVLGETFYPASAGLGQHVITLTHTTEEGCTTLDQKIIDVFDNNEAIAGLETIYCTDEPDALIPFNGKTPTYRLQSVSIDLPEDVLIDFPDTTTTDFYNNVILPSLTGPVVGDYTFHPSDFATPEIVATYTNEGGLLGSVLFTAEYQNTFTLEVVTFKQQVDIYIPPTTTMTIDLVPSGEQIESCEDNGDIQFAGFPAPSTGVSSGFFAVSTPDLSVSNETNFPGLTDNGDGNATLNTQQVADLFGFGELEVKYIYERASSGCNDTTTQVIRISPKPRANYLVPSIICEQSNIDFTDASGYLPSDSTLVASSSNNAVLPAITDWTWNFDDPNDLATVTGVPNTNHEYLAPGLSDVSLSIINEFGCTADTIIQQVIGGIPTAEYVFGGTSVNEDITFQSISSVVKSNASLNQSIDRVLWDIDGDGTFDIDDDDMDPVNNNETVFIHNYANPGIYNVQFIAVATTGCSDTLTNQIAILRNVTIDVTYSDAFESDDGGWMSLPEINGSDNSWSWGAPTKSNIVPTGTQETNIWITGLSNPYESGERSYLYSPAINFSALERPMIQFDMYRQLDEQDGVILEYSTDSLNIMDPNKEWISLGDDIGQGVDWYNAIGLAGNPGKNNATGLGWDGDSEGWLKAKYDLEETYATGTTQAEKDKIKSRIILRLGLGAITGDKTDNDGFGFDNFLMGNRTRTVLLENFTSTQNGSNLGDGKTVESENDDIRDFQATHPSLAVIQYHTNLDGTDPLSNSPAGDARALYYGIGSTPRVALDGVADPDNLFTEWAINQYGQQALNIAGVDIQTVLQSNGSNIDIISTVTARQDIPGNWVLHTIIVENLVNGSDFPSGETQFDNVVRKMIPSPSGDKQADSLLDGDSKVISNTWSPSTAFNPPEYTIIVFVQDESSKEIYQAIVVTPDISTVTGMDEELNQRSVSIYPNPSNNYFTLQLSKKVKDNTMVSVFNQMGQVIYTTEILRGNDKVQINSTHWVPGIYHVQTELDSEPVRERIIIQHK